jgi:hypothetical protein
MPYSAEMPAKPHSTVMEYLADLSDDEAANCIDTNGDHVAVHFSRRLVQTNEDLIAAIQTFKSASDTASARLYKLTWVLIGLTVVIAALTGVLLWVELELSRH